jgi:hypothetical protein
VAIRTKTDFSIDFDEKTYPRTEMVIKHPQAFVASASISWATHGLVVWSSGDHLSTRGFMSETIAGVSSKIAIETHLNNILKIARG